MTLKETAQKRRTYKEYISKQYIPDGIMMDIMITANSAPSSLGLEPYTFLIVRSNTDLMKKIINSFSGNETKLLTGSDLIIWINKEAVEYTRQSTSNWVVERFTNVLGLRDQNINKETLQTLSDLVLEKKLQLLSSSYIKSVSQAVVDWGVKQSYISLGFALLAAESYGINSTSMEGFNYERLKKILLEEKVISENEFPSVSLMLGYGKKGATVGVEQLRISLKDKVKRFK